MKVLLTLFNARYFRKQNVEIQRFFFYISHYFRHISLVVAVTSVILNLKYNKFVFFVLVHFHLMFKTFFQVYLLDKYTNHLWSRGGVVNLSLRPVGLCVITHCALFYYEVMFSILLLQMLATAGCQFCFRLVGLKLFLRHLHRKRQSRQPHPMTKSTVLNVQHPMYFHAHRKATSKCFNSHPPWSTICH